MWLNIGVEILPKYALLPCSFYIQNRFSVPQNGGLVFTVMLRTMLLLLNSRLRPSAEDAVKLVIFAILGESVSCC